mmetsp:Transcript_11436/g.46102  ORF Transcript_11436/g.46102 Transcript_11436/m.46102 type:complete len:217 (-) Transcript_11436:977-1627(-)
MTPPPPRDDATVSLANAAATSSSVQSDFTVDDVVLVLVHERDAKRSGNTSSLAPPASRGSSCASRNSIASLSGTGYARAPTTTCKRRGTGRKSVSNSAASPSHRASASRLGSVALMPMTCSGGGAAAGSRSELAPLSGLPGRFTASGLSSSSLPSARRPASPTSGDPEGNSYELASPPHDDSAAACINLVSMSSTVLPRLTSWTMCSSSTTTHASS